MFPMTEPKKPRNGSKKQINWRQAAIEVGGKKAPMPDVSPQLATLVHKPFERDGWIFEIKWDGYRTLAFKNGANTRLVSRTGKSFNKLYPHIVKAVDALPLDVIFDGEVVALNDEGKPVFNWLQHPEFNQGNIVYYVFDLLYLSTIDLRNVPLVERKKMLKGQLVNADSRIQYSDHIAKDGLAFFELVKAQGLEGMVGKDGQSTYHSGERTRDWLKVKAEIVEEFVIAGYTEPESFNYFDRLILARNADDGLHYGGRVGNGIDQRMRKKLKDVLEPLKSRKKPFPESPDWEGKKPVWIKPKLRCKVAYVETTVNGNLRHASFQGLVADTGD
jgi:bifunctional non-homologous end joining protein LigD